MLSKDLQAKKRHHYVWASYLTRWGGGTKNVFYSAKGGGVAHDHVRAIVAGEFFYKVAPLTSNHVDVIKTLSQSSPDHLRRLHMALLGDMLELQRLEVIYRKSGIQNQEVECRFHVAKCNLLENLHGSHEEKVLPILAALADERFDIFQNEQRMVEFMAFFGQQLTRTKAFRDGIIQNLSRRATIETSVSDSIAEAWWFISYMYGINLGFSLYVERNRARHALLINSTGLPFITSDHPVVNVHSCVSEAVCGAVEYADFFYPISPRVAYIICDSERFSHGCNNIDEATVMEFNIKVASQAKERIIGDSKEIIKLFQKYIGRRYKKAPLDHLQK